MDTRKRSNASGTWLDSAITQIIRNVWRKRRINRSTQLWRQRQNADVVIQDVVGNAKACTDRSRPAGARRIGNANPRTPVILGGLWHSKADQAGHTRRLVQCLRSLAKWDGCIFVAHPEVKSNVRADAPIVICKPVEGRLVAIVDGIAAAAFGQRIGVHVPQKTIQRAVIIIATRPLCERLR